MLPIFPSHRSLPTVPHVSRHTLATMKVSEGSEGDFEQAPYGVILSRIATINIISHSLLDEAKSSYQSKMNENVFTYNEQLMTELRQQVVAFPGSKSYFSVPEA